MNILKIADGITGLFPKKILVTLRDELSGNIVSVFKADRESIPSRFDRPMVMEMDGKKWRVTRVVGAGRKQVELLVQEEPLFVPKRSMVPSVAYPAPPVSTLSVAHIFTLSMRLEEWRQVEFLPAGMMEIVEEEMKDMQAVEGGLLGYERSHVRERVGDVDLGIPFYEFYQLVEGVEKGSVYLEGEGLVEDGFFVRSVEHVYYGVVRDGGIRQLAMREFDSADEEVTRVIEEWDLVVVDWCGEKVV
jgi:hypothetical protein